VPFSDPERRRRRDPESRRQGLGAGIGLVQVYLEMVRDQFRQKDTARRWC
jgi:hypothetical protein